MRTAVIIRDQCRNTNKSDSAVSTVDGYRYLMSNEPMSSDHSPNPKPITNPTNTNLNPENTQYVAYMHVVLLITVSASASQRCPCCLCFL